MTEKKSLSLLVAALFMAVVSLAVPQTARAMFACDSGGCTYYFAGGGTASGECKAYNEHCHCFISEEEDQHQDACDLQIEG